VRSDGSGGRTLAGDEQAGALNEGKETGSYQQ